MKYIEITVTVEAVHAEAAADLLRAATGDAGVCIETPFVQPDLGCEAVLRRDGSAAVRAYVRAGNGRHPSLAATREAFVHAGILADISERDVDEEDWAEAWKEHFDVARFGERIVVVPAWRAFDPTPADVVLTLDPGMAFGTGQHETTRMCLETLERAVQPGARVLDAGCGSGILALVAAKLGAREVYAVDVDEDCARIALRNAEMNGVDGRVRVGQGSVGAAWPFDQPPGGRFDVVVANIVAGTIVELAGELAAALAPGGRLIASGIIGERESEVIDAFAGVGLHVAAVRAMSDWRCIEAVRA